ncbi:CPK2, partial [Symbiodinium microadriaticum]
MKMRACDAVSRPKAHNVTKIRRATEFNQQMCVTFEIMVRGSKLYFLNIVDEGTSYQLCVPLWKEGNRFGMRIARHGNDGLDHQYGCSLTVGQSLKLSKGQALTAALAIKLQPMLHGKAAKRACRTSRLFAGCPDPRAPWDGGPVEALTGPHELLEACTGLVQGESIFDKRMASGMRERAICGRVSARGAGAHDLSQQERPPAAWNVDNNVSDEVPRIAAAPAHVAAGVDAGDTVMEEAEPGVARQEGAEELLSVSVQPAVDAGSDSPKKTLRVDNVVIKLTQALSLDGVKEWKKLLDSDAIVVHKRRQAEGANHLDTSGLKAGWCIRGYLDPALLELDTIAPTCELQIADVEGAFLRGDKLDASRGRLFIDMPRGGVEGYDDDGVIEAIKTVYGLADAPKELKNTYLFKHWKRKEGELLGKMFRQEESGEISINQSEYASKLSGVSIPVARKKLRAALGTMNWPLSGSRPDLAAWWSLFQQRVSSVEQLIEANKLTSLARGHASLEIRVRPIHIEDLQIVVMSAVNEGYKLENLTAVVDCKPVYDHAHSSTVSIKAL